MSRNIFQRTLPRNVYLFIIWSWYSVCNEKVRIKLCTKERRVEGDLLINVDWIGFRPLSKIIQNDYQLIIFGICLIYSTWLIEKEEEGFATKIYGFDVDSAEARII